jgi:subfamily B ATP-binding cassette protein HlyB/CyaB
MERQQFPMTDPIQLEQLLRCFPLLADLPAEILARLARQAQLVRVEQGQALCRAGQASTSVFFLVEGTARSVAFSPRLPSGVQTLQRLHPGAVLGLTGLDSGRCWETLMASTDLVLVAAPLEALREAINASDALGQRVHATVGPEELFGVLEAHFKDDPRPLSRTLVKATVELAKATLAHAWPGPNGHPPALDPDRLWLIADGGEAPGTAWDPLHSGPSRLLGIPQDRLAALLEPEGDASRRAPSGLQGDAARLEACWQQNRSDLDPRQLPLAPTPPASGPEEDMDPDRRPASAYPWVRGVGPLDSPIAAFRMLSDHLGLPFRRELLKRVFGDQVQRHGEASLALAGAVAESIGLQTQLLALRAEALGQLTAPLLVRWGNGLAVIYRSDRRHLVLGIPASGNVEMTPAEFREQWGESGEVLTLRVNELTPRRRFSFRWFLPALKTHRTALVEVLLASFFVQLFGLANPLLIQQVIDKVIINQSPGALGMLGLLLLVFAVFEGLLLCLRTFLFVDTTNRIDLSLGTQIIDHLFRLPLGYFDRRPVGEVSSRIAELEKVRGFLTGTALTTILDAVFSILYIGVMLIYSWQLTLLTLSVIPLLVILILTVSPIVRFRLQNRAIANAKTLSHLVEVLSSMLTVKAQNIELRSRWKWQDLYTDYISEGFDTTLLETTANTISGFLNKLSGLIVIWAGAMQVMNGTMTLGALIAFRIIAGYVTGPLLRMTSIWQSVQETALSLERLSDVIDHPQEAPDDNSRRLIMPPIRGDIRFENIHFRYMPSSPLLLKGLNLDIPHGEFVAIVGASGSGKSTLTKLLARLYTPEQGVVFLDGMDIAKVELYSLRRQIGIVPQDTVLFEGSVEENITLTNPDAETEEVIAAARVADAHDFIMALPAAYTTQVGERGSNLSGGQRQRIAIARTILQRPRLLIMDEATSALDYQTERVVSENLMATLKGCTVLFITHRLTSIVNADRIVCMGNGAVLEVGRHPDLMARRGAYYALFHQQNRSTATPAALP